uniref:Uncharacterized protein LOC111110386 n=1 Tax=Crassostrea virginica TaxID=6565 RepID=A0A8B8BGT4_CRAVI|nr:uncharacterized protein LOC111110386 [Crassostrea virginica]XP_022302576.1 uncharacterized protein LOC111110386 [Crassostrea virginica]
MAWIRSMLLVASVVLNAAGQTTEAENSGCYNDFEKCVVDGTYDKLKPDITSLNEKIKALEQSLSNRKQFRCESGSIGDANWPTMPTWPLTKNIKFKTPFETAPTVTYGLSYIDIDVSSQDRVRSEVASVTNAGFQLTVTTWQYSKLWGARATWMACGI